MTPPALKAGCKGRDGERPTASARSSLTVMGHPPKASGELLLDRLHLLPPTIPSKKPPLQESMTEMKYQAPVATNYNKDTYPSAYEEPDPASNNAFSEDLEKLREQVISFGVEIFDAFSAVNSEGQKPWMDFIFTFCPHSIELWPKGLTHKWCNFLLSRDVYVDNGCETTKSEALKRLLFRKAHIPVRSLPISDKEPLEEDAPWHNYSFPKPPNPPSSSMKDSFHNQDSLQRRALSQTNARHTADQKVCDYDDDSDLEDELTRQKTVHHQSHKHELMSKERYVKENRTISYF